MYRYGFNGKENDNEVKGTGNQIVFEERVYDSRLGRFFSVDPRSNEYPWQTPYAYHRNNPINLIDFLGGGDPPTKIDGVYFVKLRNPTARIVYNEGMTSFTKMMKGRYQQSERENYTVNLQQYKYEKLVGFIPGAMRAFSPSTGANPYSTMGQNIQDGVITGEPTDNSRGYLAQDANGKWSAGMGNPSPSSTVAFGGGIPLIVNGQLYGEEETEQYFAAKGYANQNSKSVGKVIIGINSNDNSMILAVSPDNLKEGGMTLDVIRDYLYKQGYDSVFSYDGGSSSTLIKDGKTEFVSPTWYKDNTIPAGATITSQ